MLVKQLGRDSVERSIRAFQRGLADDLNVVMDAAEASSEAEDEV